MNPSLINLKNRLDEGISSLDEFQSEFTLRASMAGYCPRLIDYELQDPKPSDINAEQGVKMLMGTALHEMWQGLLARILGDDFTGMEEEVALIADDGDYRISIPGHPDGIINLDGTKVVYELKCVSSSSFMMVVNQDQPIDSHYEQANVYAASLGLDQILFHYFNRDNGQSFFMLSPSSASLVEHTKTKLLQRVKNLKSGTIEERPYHDPTGSPCFFCSRRVQCYEGFESEVKSFDKIHVSEDSAEGRVITDYNMARTVRLDSEKTEAKMKDLVTKIMMKLGANTIEVDESGLVTTLKLGKNGNPLVSIKEKK